MARFAARTQVAVEQTRLDIERLLARYGATSFGYISGPDRAIIAFECSKRNIKITVPLKDTNKPQQIKQRWRALLLVIKAKLESVASGIETIEQAFYANIVMPDGRTIYEATHDAVKVAYDTGKVKGLLPDYSGN